MTRFLILDVFTDTPFGGNPLAVIPDATGVLEDRLQKIAREFNFSETTFVLPPEDPAHTAHVRIFTPMSEVPFAGHPTIGTAVALAGLGYPADMVLEMGVGPIAATVNGDSARFRTTVPLNRGAKPATGVVARCLSIPEDTIRTDHHLPQIAGVGLDFALVELVTPQVLAACMPDTAAFRDAEEAYPVSPDFAVMAYCRDGNAVRARMFAPLDNIQEDPATGSAAAALTGYLAELDGADLALEIDQGVEMGPPSRIATSASLSGGRVSSITVSGRAVQIAEGALTLP